MNNNMMAWSDPQETKLKTKKSDRPIQIFIVKERIVEIAIKSLCLPLDFRQERTTLRYYVSLHYSWILNIPPL